MRLGVAFLFAVPVAAKISTLPAVKFDDGFDQLFRLPERSDQLGDTNWWVSVSYKGIASDGVGRDLRVTLDGPQLADGNRKRLAAVSVALSPSSAEELGTEKSEKFDLLANLLPGIDAPKLMAATSGLSQLRAYVVTTGATKWSDRQVGISSKIVTIAFPALPQDESTSTTSTGAPAVYTGRGSMSVPGCEDLAMFYDQRGNPCSAWEYRNCQDAMVTDLFDSFGERGVCTQRSQPNMAQNLFPAVLLGARLLVGPSIMFAW